jgi:hypothetical protein
VYNSDQVIHPGGSTTLVLENILIDY